MRNLKIICQGEVCKIEKPPSLSVKTLTKYDPRKRWKREYFFKFEILATYTPGETGTVSEGVNSLLCAQGSVRYGVRFHKFSYSSSNFSMANVMLC